MPSDPKDPRPLLILAAGIACLAAWRWASHLHPGAVVPPAVGLLAPLALGALATASALAMQRLLLTNRTLRGRREVAIVPADDFDSKADAVLRFAATERKLRGWFDRRASAVRVHLTNDAEGRLVYLLSAPERAGKALQGALGACEGFEVRLPEDVLGKRVTAENMATVRTELLLARSSLEPLARLKLDPDPLQGFASVLQVARPGKGEEVSVCVDLLPASGR